MPRIIKTPESTDSRLEFTLSDVDVAYANGIRRTIISDIPVLAFNTSLKEGNKNNCEIITNTSRLNNEIIKQRLSCIPICVNSVEEFETFERNYLLQVNVENNTDEILIVTTKDFKIIKNVETGEYLSENSHRIVFPPYIDPIHGREHYIHFVRLRPRISEEISGEKINLTCKFSIETAKKDSSFNVSGTCTYKRTPDRSAMMEEMRAKEVEFRGKGLNDKEVEFEKRNWQLLDGMRIVVPNSFDFIIETVGIYSNERLVTIACKLIHTELKNIETMLEAGEITIEMSNDTKPNCYEIYFNNYDYTIGNIINHEMYTAFFSSGEIHSVSVKKIHPHDSHITMEVSLASGENVKENLTRMLMQSCRNGMRTINEIRREMKKITVDESETNR
jgi:DNA-directed RNA polymerase II subunit RPB3